MGRWTQASYVQSSKICRHRQSEFNFMAIRTNNHQWECWKHHFCPDADKFSPFFIITGDKAPLPNRFYRKFTCYHGAGTPNPLVVECFFIIFPYLINVCIEIITICLIHIITCLTLTRLYWLSAYHHVRHLLAYIGLYWPFHWALVKRLVQ